MQRTRFIAIIAVGTTVLTSTGIARGANNPAPARRAAPAPLAQQNCGFEWDPVTEELVWICHDSGNSATNTPAPTRTVGPTKTPQPSNTPKPTKTFTPAPTKTSTPLPTATATRTVIPTKTLTPAPTKTSTPVPTSTKTPIPSKTFTPAPTATATRVPTKTNTPIPSKTFTPGPTNTATRVPTKTNTPPPTGTFTPVPTATRTPIPSATHTPLPTATRTLTPIPTQTPIPTHTPIPSPTTPPTATSTRTPVPSNTPVPTATPLPTATPVPPTPTPQPTPDLWATLIALPTSTPDTTSTGDPLPSPCRFDGGSIQCSDDSGRSWMLPVNERVGCPVNEIIRRPYPRAMVTYENTFALLPNEWFPSAGGKWSAPQNPYDLNGLVDADGNPTVENIVRNVRFGLRSQRLTKGTIWLGQPVEDVKWTFSGPSSNGDPGTQYGITTTYSYAAASYTGPGAPAGAVAGKGRAFDRTNRVPSGTYNLPAYPVTLQTYCGFWYAIAMERSVAYWQQLSSCINQELDEDNEPILPAGFSHEGCPSGQIAFGETRYRWEVWNWIPWTRHDMREEGFETPYVPVRKATGGGIFQNRIYQEPTGNGIWVPVVEAQTVQLGN